MAAKKQSASKAAKQNPDELAQSANAEGLRPAKSVVEATSSEDAVTTTESESFTGRKFAAQQKSDDPRFYAVPRAQAYGMADKAEHKKSGYDLPDYFYEVRNPELEQHKVAPPNHGKGDDE